MTDNCMLLLALSAWKDGGDDSVPPMRFRRASLPPPIDVQSIACTRRHVHTRARSCAYIHTRVHTGTRSTGIWHKADISISTGIPPTTSPRRRHGTTLSAETCIPVISLSREPRERLAASVAIVRRRRTSYYRPKSIETVWK